MGAVIRLPISVLGLSASSTAGAEISRGVAHLRTARSDKIEVRGPVMCSKCEMARKSV